MAFEHKGRTIHKVAVIGSGQIGPDIALYFAKTLSPEGVKTVVVDVSADAIAKGKAKTPYEFGVKVSVAVTAGEGLVVGMRSWLFAAFRDLKREPDRMP